jgi:hypothetical protein
MDLIHPQFRPQATPGGAWQSSRDLKGEEETVWSLLSLLLQRFSIGYFRYLIGSIPIGSVYYRFNILIGSASDRLSI